MKEHKLKVKKDYLENILINRKRSEVRLNDRDYQLGDICHLYKYESLNLGKINSYDGIMFSYKITHIHSGLGMADNYVVLSFRKV